MHYFEDTQTRENNLTDLIVGQFGDYIIPALTRTDRPFCILVHLQKPQYNRIGDIDVTYIPLKKWLETGEITLSSCTAIEVKSCHFNESSEFKSLKLEKHKKQLERLIEEGWGRIFLCDIVESVPSDGWFHDLGFLVRDEFEKQVGVPGCGHIMTSVHPIAGRGEERSGSIGGPTILSTSSLFAHTSLSDSIEKALSVFFDKFIDRKKIISGDWIIRLKWNPERKEYFAF